MKTTKLINQKINGVLLAGLLAASPSVLRAAQTVITKADTTTMNLAADWGGTAPATNEIGSFDATISAAHEAALTLGGNIQLDALQFLGTLNGPVTIGGANTLTLGASAGTTGFDLSTANAAVTINCPLLFLGGDNTIFPLPNSGITLTLNGVLSGTSGASFISGNNGNGGVVNINGGGSIGGSSYFSVNSGTVNINTNALTVSPAYRLNVGWNNVNPGILNISNTTLTMSSSVDVDVGGGYNGIQNAGTGTINIGGTSGTPGLFNLGTTTGNFLLGVAAGKVGSGTLNLNAYGTLATGRAITLQALANSGMVNFNGGTLKLTAAQANMIGSTILVTNNGGATIDCQTFAGTLPAAINGTGGLTKLGSGTLTLSGANTYSGATTVSVGKLVTTTASIGAGSYSVADGQTLNVKVSAAGKTLTNSTLTVGSSTGATLEFDTSTLGNTTAAIIKATTVTLNGTVTVNVYGTALTIGTFDLLAYGSKTGTFTLGSLPPGVGATLNDTGAKLQLVVSTANTSLLWRGNVSSTWDINNSGNATWLGLPNSVSAYYVQSAQGGVPVTFDDTATGSTAITLGVAVTPSSVTLSNNSAAYSITGAGSISGSIGITKNGTGTFSLGTSNTFTGSTTLNAGKLALASGDNRLPATALNFGGSATLDLGGNNQRLLNVVSPASGTGVISNGNLTLTLSGQDFNPNPTNSTLDMSGLTAFTVNNVAQNFSYNVGGSTAGTFNIYLYLAATGAGTNFLAVNGLNPGSGGAISSGASPMTFMYLGQNNVINANSINLAGYKGSGSMSFKSGLVNPKVTIRGTNGMSALPQWNICYLSTGAYAEVATNDFTGGTIDCVVSNLVIGQHIAGANTVGVGVLTIDGSASSVVATNVTLSQKTGSGNGALVGTINQLNGTVQIQNLLMGDNQGGFAVIQAAYNLTGGSLLASNITIGAGSVNGGFRTINWTNGTIQNYNSTTPLAIASGVLISAPGSGNRYFAVGAGLTNVLQNQVSQVAATASPIVMNGPGTLDLQGSVDNSYLGLNVSNGLVLLDNRASSGSIHSIGNGLSLNGGTARLAGSGSDQIADANLVTINSGTFDLNGQTETIGGLAGTGGTLADSSLGSGSLTVNVASGSNYVCAANITDGNLTFGGSGTQTLTGTDSRSTESTTINGGVLQIGNGGASGSIAGSGITVNSPGALAFNRSGTLNFAGSISGSGNVVQNGSGTLILSGSDSHTGSTLVNTGTLAVPSSASTVGGSVITVASGATFNTTAGSGFYIQGNQILNGSGMVNGSYILSTGATNYGNLTVTGNVTLADGSVFNPGAAFTAGTIAVTGNVTFSGGNPNLIYNLASTTTPGGGTNSLLTVSGTLDLSALSAGALNLYIRGTPASGTYVIASAGSIVGSASAITVTGSTRYTYTPQIVGNQLRLVVAGNAGNLTWLGDGSDNVWDPNDSANKDWTNNTSHVLDFFNTGDNALFNDLSANPTVNITGDLLPASVTVNNSAVNYTFADNGGTIDGPVALTKTNSGTLTIQNNNTFSGPVNLNGGLVTVATVAPNGSAQPLGAGSALNFNGGTFQYTGPAVGVGGFGRSISLGANGGTFDQESSGGIYLFVTNTITGAGALTKVGSQQLILGDVPSGTGSNSYAGGTYINNGNLQIRNASALGTGTAVISTNGSLSADGGFTGTITNAINLTGGTLEGGPANYNYGGKITLLDYSYVGGTDPLTISGQISGSVMMEKNGSGTLTLLNNNNDNSGGTYISGGTIQLGTNGTSGWLAAEPLGIALTNNGTIIFNRADTNAENDSITGTGGLTQNGSGTTILGGASTFTGNVTLNAGALLVTNSSGLGNGAANGAYGSTGEFILAGNVTINNNFQIYQRGVINGGVGAQPAYISNQSGNNTILGTISMSTGGNYWAFNSDSGLLTLASISSSAGGFIRWMYLEGAGNGDITNITDTTGNYLQLVKYGAGTWTISGSADAPQGLQVNAGTLVVDATGTINQDSNAGMSSTVSGGTLIVNGSLAGSVTVNTGTLGGAGSVATNVNVNSSGTLWPGVGGSISTFTVSNNLTISGNLKFSVNKSLTQSNDLVVVAGVLTNTSAGTLTVTNLNYLAPLMVGDKFTLFSQPLTNGNALTVAGGGASVTWTNNLAVDGSISVLSITPPVTVNTNTFTITNIVSGNNLNLSWPADRKGWRLQDQTNSLSTGLGTNWHDWPNSTNLTSVSVPINPGNPSVFFRMIYP
jgi:fibronectin-binding autotransporter adhesin